jgi:hypothetical protein
MYIVLPHRIMYIVLPHRIMSEASRDLHPRKLLPCRQPAGQQQLRVKKVV